MDCGKKCSAEEETGPSNKQVTWSEARIKNTQISTSITHTLWHIQCIHAHLVVTGQHGNFMLMRRILLGVRPAVCRVCLIDTCWSGTGLQSQTGHQAVSIHMLSSSTNILDFTLRFPFFSVVSLSPYLLNSPWNLYVCFSEDANSLIVCHTLFLKYGPRNKMGHGPPFNGTLSHKECLDEPGSWGQSDFIQIRSGAYRSPN